MAFDPTRETTPRPARLPPLASARVPVDGGLAGLGLVALASAGAGITMALALFVFARTFGVGGADGAVPTMLIFTASLVRSGFHIAAGRACTRRSAFVAESTRRYLWASIAHTALVVLVTLLVFLERVSTSSAVLAFALAVALMAWPVTLLLLVARPSIKAIFGTAKTFDLALVPADRSVTSAGLLMTLFASLFLLADLGLFVHLVANGTPVTRATVIWFLALALFAARSSLHLGWGLAALRGKLDFSAFDRATTTYLWLAFGTVVAALGGMFAIEEFRLAFRKAPINIIYVAVTLVAALMAWPAALRAFVQDTVPHWDRDADRDRPYRPAVDRGLTTLGYLLVCGAVLLGAQLLLALVGVDGTAALGAGHAPELLVLVALLAATGTQLWAGLELVGMRPRYPLATAVYAAVALIANALSLGVGDHATLDPTLAGFAFVDTVLGFVLPIVVFALSRMRPSDDDAPVGPTAP